MAKQTVVLLGTFFLAMIFLLGKKADASNIQMTPDGVCYVNSFYYSPGSDPAFIPVSLVVPCDYPEDEPPNPYTVYSGVCVVGQFVTPYTGQVVTVVEDCSIYIENYPPPRT